LVADNLSKSISTVIDSKLSDNFEIVIRLDSNHYFNYYNSNNDIYNEAELHNFILNGYLSTDTYMRMISDNPMYISVVTKECQTLQLIENAIQTAVSDDEKHINPSSFLEFVRDDLKPIVNAVNGKWVNRIFLDAFGREDEEWEFVIDG